MVENTHLSQESAGQYPITEGDELVSGLDDPILAEDDIMGLRQTVLKLPAVGAFRILSGSPVINSEGLDAYTPLTVSSLGF